MLAGIGLALEVWDTWKKVEREQKLNEAILKMVENFENQRKELIDLLDGEDFINRFFSDYIVLRDDVNEVVGKVAQQRARSARFHDWRSRGESLSVEFREILR